MKNEINVRLSNLENFNFRCMCFWVVIAISHLIFVFPKYFENMSTIIGYIFLFCIFVFGILGMFYEKKLKVKK